MYYKTICEQNYCKSTSYIPKKQKYSHILTQTTTYQRVVDPITQIFICVYDQNK